MGFFSGFGDSVSKGVDAAVESRNRQKEDNYKLTLQNYLSRRGEYEKTKKDQAEWAARAKEYASMFGQDQSTAREVYNWLEAGVSDAVITDRLEKYKVVPVEPAPGVELVDNQMSASGLDPRPDMLGSSSLPDPVRLSVDRSIARIAEATGETSESIQGVMSGTPSRPPEIGTGKAGSFKLVPKETTPDKLTDADVAGQYVRLKQEVAQGVAGAETRLEAFETVTLKAYQTAKASLDTPSGDNLLPSLFEAYLAAPEGSSERERYAGRIEAHRRAVELKKGDAQDGFKPAAVFLPDGTVDVRPVKTILDEAGNRVYVGLDAGRQVAIDGGVQMLTDDQKAEMRDIYKDRSTTISEFEDQMVATADAVRLSAQVFDLVDADPRVLTRAAGAARFATDASREVFTAVDILSDLAQERGSVSRSEIESALGGSLQTVEGRINEALGAGITDLGEKRALLDAKILLSGFRLGSLEGQSGNGLSNQDFNRILEIVDSSSNPETFKTAWGDYVRGRVSALDTKASIVNGHNARIEAFYELNGFRPDQPVITSLSDFIAQSEDTGLRGAAAKVLGVPREPARPNVQNKAVSTSRNGAGTSPATTLPARPEAGSGDAVIVNGVTLTPAGTTPDGRQKFTTPTGKIVVPRS